MLRQKHKQSTSKHKQAQASTSKHKQAQAREREHFNPLPRVPDCLILPSAADDVG